MLSSKNKKDNCCLAQKVPCLELWLCTSAFLFPFSVNVFLYEDIQERAQSQNIAFSRQWTRVKKQDTTSRIDLISEGSEMQILFL